MIINKQRIKTILPTYLFAFLLIPICLLSQPKKDTLFINSQGEYPLYQHLYIYKSYKDVSANFVYDSVKASDFIKLNPNKAFNGFSDLSKQYWLVATVKNNLPHSEIFYWWLNSPAMFTARIYKQQGNKTLKYETASGYFKVGLKRQNTDNDVDFHFLLQSGESATFIISLVNEYDPGGYFLPKLSDIETYNNDRLWYYGGLSIIAGIMGAALLLNLFFGLFLKEKIHFIYAGYIISITFEMFEWEGIAERVVDTDRLYNEALVDLLPHICPGIFLVFLGMIMQWFLRQEKRNSKLKTTVDGLIYLLIGIVGIYTLKLFFVFPMLLNSILVNLYCLNALLLFLLIIASSIEKIIQGYKPAWIYLLAVCMPLLGVIEVSLGFMGYDDIEVLKGTYPSHLEIGIVVETIMVFMGIVYRSAIHKKEKEGLLIELNNQQMNLINEIVGAQEAERKRIAEDLHDDAGATLNALVMHINNMPEDIRTGGSSKKYYQQLVDLSSNALTNIRSIAHNMVPKDFKASDTFMLLEQRINELNELGKTKYQLITDGSDEKLSNQLAITIYRIINELCANISKHAEATDASIQLLIEDKQVQILVEDNGIGYDNNLPSKGIGIKNINSRIAFLKGTVHVDSNKDGTVTIIEIPIL